MVKVSVVVRSGAAHFGVALWAESIERAVGLARKRYPGSDIRLSPQVGAPALRS